ncbi:hypothetical protein EHQ61_08625 [Leptospira wolffii]|uniref:acyl carrier protein n=1 Tax=Leptospira wolffii TaxID=409998 RepID=UPI001084220A|nr:acyl carrier protein [Leptospira wolffii]TGL50814.1 hypothetical protein EHQ61_08625 [Leptospira wolffii]
MDHSKLTQIFLESLKEVLISANIHIDNLHLDMNIEKDLGLTSQDGLNLALTLEDKLGITFPPDYNPFIDDKTGKFLKLKEIIKRLPKFIQKSKQNV